MTDSDAALTRHVCYDDIVTYCARCATSLPAVAASTAARAPATVTLDFACPGALPDGLLHVTVRELSFQDGGLGFRLFPAAVWHAAWLAQHFLPLLVQAGQPQGPLRVLELGAGLALCGLTVAVAAKATGVAVQVTLSDFNPGLLTAAEAACTANGVAHCTDVAFLDWVADAADGGQLSRETNPEYFRVTGGPCPHAHASPLQLPPDAAFDVIIATEVLYESGAATALPAVILRRMDRKRGGRFCTLMAVRDTELLRTCVATLAKLTPSVLPGLQLRMCVAPASALPLPSKQQPGAGGASDAAVERSTRGDMEPMCVGQRWMSAAECDAVICGGAGGKGGPLQAAWLEALWTPDGSREQVLSLIHI
jgi:predicted nicotinamide N-methyase